MIAGTLLARDGRQLGRLDPGSCCEVDLDERAGNAIILRERTPFESESMLNGVLGENKAIDLPLATFIVAVTIRSEIRMRLTPPVHRAPWSLVAGRDLGQPRVRLRFLRKLLNGSSIYVIAFNPASAELVSLTERT